MTKHFETQDIALNKLVLHPRNVRARSEHDDLSELASNIKAHGLLQPLVVAVLDVGSFGVLAGGRRLAALTLLAKDKSAKGFSSKMNVPCRIVPEGADISSLSFSENETQLPMTALDRYEAFAAMASGDGLAPAEIANRFGITERAVKEALRLGNIHRDIRDAHRRGQITLDVLRAFDHHPDPKVQLEVFTSLDLGGYVQAYHVRSALSDRGIRQGDSVAQFVLDSYKKAGGEIIPDLIEEDSILSDQELINRLHAEELENAAEAKRAALGFAWSEIALNPDWDAFAKYGRVYPTDVDPDTLSDEARKRLTEIEAELDRLEALEEQAGGLEEDDIELVDTLEAERRSLTEAYAPEDLACAGVIAVWDYSRLDFMVGMVRPEDRTDQGAPKTSDPEQKQTGPKISEKLKTDLAHIRSRAVGLSLAQNPDIARAFAEYTLVVKTLVFSSYADRADSEISASIASRDPEDATGSLLEIMNGFDALYAELGLEDLDLSRAGGFERFCALEDAQRGAVVAYAVLRRSLHPPNSRPPVRWWKNWCCRIFGMFGRPMRIFCAV